MKLENIELADDGYYVDVDGVEVHYALTMEESTRCDLCGKQVERDEERTTRQVYVALKPADHVLPNLCSDCIEQAIPASERARLFL